MASSRTRKLAFFAYYFYPAKSVGAKRMSELAYHLSVREEIENIEVYTLSLGEKEKDKSLVSNLKNIELIEINDSDGILRKVIHFWHKIRRPHSAKKRHTANGLLGKCVDSPLENNYWLKIKRNFHALEAVVDESKLWSLKVFGSFLYRSFKGRADKIVVSGPPFSPMIAAWFVKKLFATPYILDFRDPWIGNRQRDPGSESAVRSKIESYIEKKILFSASEIVVASPGIKNVLARNYGADILSKVKVIYNGYDSDSYQKADYENRKVSLLYAGMLYYNRNPLPLFEAIKRLKTKYKVPVGAFTFTLVGECSHWAGIDLKNWVRTNGLDGEIVFVDSVPSAELVPYIEKSNVLVNFSQGQVEQIPAKTYEYLATGRPMIVITEDESDTAEIVRVTRSGVVVENTIEDIFRTIEVLYTDITSGDFVYLVDQKRVAEFSRRKQNEIYCEIV